MQLAYMIIGTLEVLIFVIQMFRGKKYETYVENLDENKFPLASIYTVGFAWTFGGPFKLKGEQAGKLKSQAAILYESQFAEFYANVVWAQMITFIHLFTACTFLLAGAFYEKSGMMLLVGIFVTVLAAVYSMTNMKNVLSERTANCETQLADVVSTLAILVNSGMVLRDAWFTIADSSDGDFYELMKRAKNNMQNGYSDIDAMYIFGKESNSPDIKKFTSVLIQSLEKGGGEIGVFLAAQSSELWSSKKQRMLQAGEKAATKLLLPIMIIFIGILIIVLTAGFAGALF